MSIAPSVEPGPKPGPIDNSNLVNEEAPSSSDFSEAERQEATNLRGNMIERQHFVSLSAPTFRLLTEWYGLAGRAVSREYMVRGSSAAEVDVHQWHFKVFVEGEEDNAVTLASSELVSVSPMPLLTGVGRTP